MTEKQKRIAIVGGTIIVAILLLLWLRRGGATAGQTVEGSPYDMPAVYGPTLGPIYVDGGGPWNFPGLNLSGPDLSMIGACCSDCGQASSYVDPYYSGSRNTYVFNASDQGPNIFNYYAPTVAPADTWGGLRFTDAIGG